MARKRQFEAATLQEALGKASAALGVPEPDLHYEIVDTGRRGLFGLGQKDVCIRVEAPEAQQPPNAQELSSAPHYEVTMEPSATCGLWLDATMGLSGSGFDVGSSFTIETGVYEGDRPSTDTPITIPKSAPSGVYSFLTVPDCRVTNTRGGEKKGSNLSREPESASSSPSKLTSSQQTSQRRSPETQTLNIPVHGRAKHPTYGKSMVLREAQLAEFL